MNIIIIIYDTVDIIITIGEIKQGVICRFFITDILNI